MFCSLCITGGNSTLEGEIWICFLLKKQIQISPSKKTIESTVISLPLSKKKTRMTITPALLDYLKELKVNNNREWFNANKERYEVHQVFMKQYVAALEEEMEKYNKTLPEDKIKIKSAFMFFCEEVIDSVKNDLPYNSSKKILKEKLSEMWKETKINNKEEFKKYKSLAKEYQNK